LVEFAIGFFYLFTPAGVPGHLLSIGSVGCIIYVEANYDKR